MQGSTTNRENLVQIKGVAVDTNSGNKSDGTQRVVLATDQPTVPVDTGLVQPTTPTDTQPVSASSLPLPTGASTLSEQQTQTTHLASIAGEDFATQTTLATRLSESDFDTKTGSLTETAPASDTASSGLNGRLQRIAQRLTSLIALFPTALTGSGNFKVAVQEFSSTVSVQGDVAHDAVDSGNPVKIGFKAKNYGSLPTAVADAERVNGYADRYGAQFVNIGSSYMRPENYRWTSDVTNVNILPSAVGASEIVRTYKLLIVIDYDVQSVQNVTIGYGSSTTPTGSGCLFDGQGVAPGVYEIDCCGTPGLAGEELRMTTTGYTTGTNSVRVLYDIISI